MDIKNPLHSNMDRASDEANTDIELDPIVNDGLRRQAAELAFQKAVATQTPGWYHWTQISRLMLAFDADRKAYFKVILIQDQKPSDGPRGILSSWLEVNEAGHAIIDHEATNQEYDIYHEEYTNFKIREAKRIEREMSFKRSNFG